MAAPDGGGLKGDDVDTETVPMKTRRQGGGFRLRPHQQKLAVGVLADLRAGKDEVVLAACPGFGKTETAIHIVRTLLREGRIKRALVLAHGTQVLRSNFRQRLALRAPELLDRHQVMVAIPQEHRRIEGDFDLLVVDEAHEFYEVAGGLVERIREKVGARQALLLTGTPSRFIRKGSPSLHAFPLFDLIRDGWAADVRVMLSESAYQIGEKDWNERGEVRDEVRYGKRATDKTIDSLFAQFGADAGLGVEKTIIACKDIEMAGWVSRALSRREVRHLLSENEVDPDSGNVAAFRQRDCSTLVVVKRATLGFDMPSLVNFIDLTGSRNPDRIFQMICRLVRLPDGGAGSLKTFVKVMPKAFSGEPLRYFMSGVCMLGDREHYTTWQGGSLYRLKVPAVGSRVAALEGESKRQRPAFEGGMMMFGDVFASSDGMAKTSLRVCLGRRGAGDAASNKQAILEFVHCHARRPRRGAGDRTEWLLGSLLSHYISPSSAQFDGAFKTRIDAVAPPRQDPNGRKARILAFIRLNGRRPSTVANVSEAERRLAGVMHGYLSRSSPKFDESFRSELAKLAPDRVSKNQAVIEENKKLILKFASLAGHRPRTQGAGLSVEEKRLRRAMQYYISPGSRNFDPAFRDALLALAPLIPRSEEKKAAIKAAVREFALKHGRRPYARASNKAEKALAQAMAAFISPSSSAYDGSFRDEMGRLVPFRRQPGSSEKSTGETRP